MGTLFLVVRGWRSNFKFHFVNVNRRPYCTRSSNVGQPYQQRLLVSDGQSVESNVDNTSNNIGQPYQQRLLVSDGQSVESNVDNTEQDEDSEDEETAAQRIMLQVTACCVFLCWGFLMLVMMRIVLVMITMIMSTMNMVIVLHDREYNYYYSHFIPRFWPVSTVFFMKSLFAVCLWNSF